MIAASSPDHFAATLVRSDWKLGPMPSLKITFIECEFLAGSTTVNFGFLRGQKLRSFVFELKVRLVPGCDEDSSLQSS